MADQNFLFVSLTRLWDIHYQISWQGTCASSGASRWPVFRHSFPVRSVGKLLFPTFLLQSGPRLSQTCTAALPSQLSASTLAVGRQSSVMPRLHACLLPTHLGEDCGTGPSLTGMHCCLSEEAHIQCPCHETIMLFNGGRNKCSESLAGSGQLPPAWGCVPAKTSGMG